MKRRCSAAVLACVFTLTVARPVDADVTIKMTTGGKGMGMAAKSTGTTYIKGNKMRSDLIMGDRTQSMIFDLDAQKMYIFESKKKEADVWDMAAFGAEIAQNIDAAGMKASVKPNGQTKAFGALSAAGYDMEISVPTTLGGNKDAQMTMTLTGPVWIVKNAPGAAEYTRFYKTAAEKGWIFSDPRAAKGQPGQAKAMAEMYKQFSEIGGIAYESDMNIKMGMGGSGGPLGGLLAKMGNMSVSTLIEGIETGPVADALFAPPTGYKLNSKK